MSVTQLARTGSGQIDDTSTSFQWSGLSHSSMQGILKMKLGTKITRKVLPGNEVVHQALSAAWEPIQFSGEWRDIWMGQGEANRTYLEFSRMAQKLPLVRVTVDGQSFIGMLMDPEFGYHNDGWIDWSFTLSPEQNENVSNDVDLGTGGPITQKSLPQWFQEAVDKTIDMRNIVFQADHVPLSTEDQLDTKDALGEIDDAMERIEELSTVVGVTTDLVSNALNQGTDVTDSVWALPTAYERLMRASLAVGAVASTQRADLALSFDDFILALEFESYVHETTIRSWDLVGHSVDAARDFRSKSSQRARAIYQPAPGESLERISMRFYQTPDNADLIYRTNHLSSIVLDGTEMLIIPEVGA